MKEKIKGGCKHDNCDTCPYPDCIATQHQIDHNQCGSKKGRLTDIVLPNDYKPEAKTMPEQPKPKAVIKSDVFAMKWYAGKEKDIDRPETPEEKRKRQKHESYLRCKEKKAKMESTKAQSEEKDRKTVLELCNTCVHEGVCKYAEATKKILLLPELPLNIRLICTFYREER